MARPLRILHLYPKADYFTGAAVQLHELAAGQAGRGHAVTVVTPPSAEWASRCDAAGVRHLALPMARAFDLRSVWRLARVLRADPVDIAHAHKGRARTLVLLAGFLGPEPLLVLNRGVSFPLSRLSRLGYTSRRVHAIVAVCDAIRQRLVTDGVAADKIVVIYSGTDLRRFHPAVDGSRVRAELRIEPDQFLITQVGARSWRGWEDVLDAMARVAAAAPQARLCFVGAPATRAAEIAGQASRRGLHDHVLACGHREDMPHVLAASDLVVDASFAGLGITGSIREALACERPVVATRVAGMPELVIDGETGLLVPPRDPAALAAAILCVVRDPGRAHTLARAGRKRVEAQFSREAKLDATDALYRRLLRARASR